MIRGAVPLSIEFKPVVAPAQIQQPVVISTIPERRREQPEQSVVAPAPPALEQFPGRRNPMPTTALPDVQRPVAHFTPMPTMAMPIE